MEHRTIIKGTRIIALILALIGILSMETGVTAAKVAFMVIGLAWLALGVYADDR